MAAEQRKLLEQLMGGMSLFYLKVDAAAKGPKVQPG